MEEICYINQTVDSHSLISLDICGTTFPDKNYRIERKKSETACIEYIEEGYGTVELDGKIFYPKAGDSYFLFSGQDQLYYSDEKAPWKKYFINLSGKLLDSLIDGYSLRNASHFEGLDIRPEMLEIIEIAKKSSSVDSTPEILKILNVIFFKMRQSLVKKEEKKDISSEMIEFLNTRLMKKFSVSELCQYIAKSESQTIRIFKKACGMTPYSYVIEKRIELAKKMLDNTAMKVREIAEQLCFADEYYFSNLFKSKTGMSPLVYRNRDKS